MKNIVMKNNDFSEEAVSAFWEKAENFKLELYDRYNSVKCVKLTKSIRVFEIGE